MYIYIYFSGKMLALFAQLCERTFEGVPFGVAVEGTANISIVVPQKIVCELAGVAHPDSSVH